MPKLQLLPFTPPNLLPQIQPSLFFSPEIKEENDLVLLRKVKRDGWEHLFLTFNGRALLVRHYKRVFCERGSINFLHQDGESICTRNVKHRNKWIKLISSCQPRRLIPRQLHQEAEEQLTCNDWARWDHSWACSQHWLRVPFFHHSHQGFACSVIIAIHYCPGESGWETLVQLLQSL